MTLSAVTLLEVRRSELFEIDATRKSWSKITEWHARTRPVLSRFFPMELEQFDTYLKFQWAKFARVYTMGGGSNQNASTDAAESRANDSIVSNAKNKLLAHLDAIIEVSKCGEVNEFVPPRETTAVGLSVFIVHGHDEEMKQSVARTLERLGLTPIILHEQYDGGRVIIEKLEQHGNVGFAVVLLSPDDAGYKKADGAKAAKPRARQNVILELGYFVGRLGRGKVMALIRGNDLEVPGDFDGVVYTPFDEHEGWQKKLVKELKAVGYSIDANAL